MELMGGVVSYRMYVVMLDHERMSIQKESSILQPPSICAEEVSRETSRLSHRQIQAAHGVP